MICRDTQMCCCTLCSYITMPDVVCECVCIAGLDCGHRGIPHCWLVGSGSPCHVMQKLRAWVCSMKRGPLLCWSLTLLGWKWTCNCAGAAPSVPWCYYTNSTRYDKAPVKYLMRCLVSHTLCEVFGLHGAQFQTPGRVEHEMLDVLYRRPWLPAVKMTQLTRTGMESQMCCKWIPRL